MPDVCNHFQSNGSSVTLLGGGGSADAPENCFAIALANVVMYAWSSVYTVWQIFVCCRVRFTASAAASAYARRTASTSTNTPYRYNRFCAGDCFITTTRNCPVSTSRTPR